MQEVMYSLKNPGGKWNHNELEWQTTQGAVLIRCFLFFFEESSAFVNKIKFCCRRNSRGKGTKRHKFSPFFLFLILRMSHVLLRYLGVLRMFSNSIVMTLTSPALYFTLLKLGFTVNLNPCKTVWSQTLYYIWYNRL